MLRDTGKCGSVRTLAVALVVCLICEAAALAQVEPRATDLGGKPFFIKKTWEIGGEGNWDYLTLDPAALQLFVAHGPVVQVIDLSNGTKMGSVGGMKDAHGIALDDSGDAGFVSDGPANQVKVFDRRSLSVIASIPTGPNPRAVVYEPLTKLVFAICTQPVSGPGIAPAASLNPQGGTSRTSPVQPTETVSVVTVIDADSRTALGDLLFPGKLGFALADGRGEVYVSIVDRNRIAHFNAQSIADEFRHSAAPPAAAPRTDGKPDPDLDSRHVTQPTIDWSAARNSGNIGSPGQRADNRLHFFRLGPGCQQPTGLAMDSAHLRLFAACNNQKLEVLNSDTGEVVASLTIGPGADAIAYDSVRSLIYTANGAGYGSMTIIQQSVTDSYAVIQELPTKERARTLAINPQTGLVYLVTNLMGFDVHQKPQGGSTYTLPVITATAVKGSFQVLVIGN